MTSIADTLWAIEARSERAIILELRTMMQEILAIRTSLVLQERNQADALLLTLDRLTSSENQAHSGDGAAVPSVRSMRLDEVFNSRPVVYKAFFFDHEFDLANDFPVNFFQESL